MKKNTFLLSITFFLTTFLFLNIDAFAENDRSISGHYHCKGQDKVHLRMTYQNDLTITKTKETYQFEWRSKKLGTYKGTGYFAAGSNDIIAIAFYQTSKMPKPHIPNIGVQIYKVNQDGSLEGQWTYVGQSELNPVEICMKR